METIRNWAFSVCAAAIVGSVMTILLPEGSIQKTFKTVLCIFFLCTVFSPLSKVKFPDIKEFFNDNESNETVFVSDDTSYIKFIENKLSLSVKEALDEAGIKTKDILTKVNISEDGSIYISKFALCIEDNSKSEKAFKIAYEKIGIEPEIILYGEHENG